MTDQNKYTDANGVRYVAADEIRGCQGCAFEEDADHACSEALCLRKNRDDNRDIIWIKAA